MEQLPLDIPHTPSWLAADYCVSNSNTEAVAWVRRWPEWPVAGLIVYGPTGCGKSHLAHMWAEQSGANILQNLPDMAEPSFKQDKTPLVLEDAETWLQGEAAEEGLFHLYNFLMEKNRYFLLTMDCPPAQLDVKLPDLRSRLLYLPSVGILPPDDTTLQSLLVKLAHDRGFNLPPAVIQYVLPRMPRSYDSAALFMEKLDSLTLALKKPATVAVAKQALGMIGA